MREILFKAKRLDNDEWVEGNLILTPKADEDLKAIIIPFDDNGEYTEGVYNNDLGFEIWYKVDITTICQYTGLTDKNGQKIWENDIVKDVEFGEYRAVVAYGAFNCSCCNGVYGWTFESTGGYSQVCDIRDTSMVEVIGNIFDNKELLGG